MRFSRMSLGLAGVGLAVASLAASAPNIVVIMSDDQGYADVSYSPHSADYVQTPHIDALAKGGVVCTDGYASGYVCSPTRAGLMTGRYQQRFGIYTAGQGGSGMPLDEIWMPTHLKQAGYRSAAFGKWHLGLTEEYNAVNRGFDYFYGFMGRGAHDFWDHSPDSDVKFGGPVFRNLEVLENEEGYMTTLITQEAVDFIKREKDHPFFAYVAYNAVHTPAQAPEEDVARYDTGDETRNILMAMLHHLDLGVGEIVKTLKEEGVYENTIIIYLSDNGGAGAMNADNTPLRGMKQYVHEGGIRVPFIVSWPEKLKPGTCSVPVWSTDILPSALAAAGIDPVPGSKPLDGKNFFPALAGKTDQLHDALYWSSGSDGKWAVRKGDWKYLFDRGEVGLYNLKDDIAEAENLKDKHPEKFQELEKMYTDWFVKMGEPAQGTKHYAPKGAKKKKKKK